MLGCQGGSTQPGHGLTNSLARQAQYDEPVRFQGREDDPAMAATRDEKPPTTRDLQNFDSPAAPPTSAADEPIDDAEDSSSAPAQLAPRSPEPKRDPGADLIIDSLFAGIDHPDQAFPVVVRLTNLRNMSRSTDREFEAFCERLAELLDRSGARHGISVVTDTDADAKAEAEAEFELSGSAYLMTRHGFDQWELYLKLRRTGQTWTVWEPEEPVRVLRQPIVNSPQILVGRLR